mmetsp:Transcript_10176/g.41210  ORF Transcript_10176/g.41210 Transcript_10176/m.41210 type:complete len:346 (+) Transcript_10176:1366-2403(+)
MVLRRRRRQALLDRRHVLADRDGRPRHDAAARRDAHEARVVLFAVLRRRAQGPRLADRRRRPGEGLVRRRPRARDVVARRVPDGVGRPRTVHEDLSSAVRAVLLHGRRLPPRRRRVLLDHGPRRRRAQHLGPPHRHGGSRVGSGCARGRRAGRDGRIPARHQGAGHLLLLGTHQGLRGVPGTHQGLEASRPRRDRPLRDARPHHPRRGPAQNEVGQDNAPHPAESRRRRGVPARRHHHARRPLGRRLAHRQSQARAGPRVIGVGALARRCDRCLLRREPPSLVFCVLSSFLEELEVLGKGSSTTWMMINHHRAFSASVSFFRFPFFGGVVEVHRRKHSWRSRSIC